MPSVAISLNPNQYLEANEFEHPTADQRPRHPDKENVGCDKCGHSPPKQQAPNARKDEDKFGRKQGHQPTFSGSPLFRRSRWQITSGTRRLRKQDDGLSNYGEKEIRLTCNYMDAA